MKIYFIIAFFTVLFVACIDDKDTLTEVPSLELISPQPCDTLYFGTSFVFRVKLSDNTGLGFISMNGHNNFGHHNHGTHEGCNMDQVKQAVHPYATPEDSAWVFELPKEKLEFTFDTLLSLPALTGDTIPFDEGDYHFHIYLTDNDGYSTFTTLDVKILN